MENEERHILEAFGRQNPFGVPEGYFDRLPARIMDHLPETNGRSRRVQLRRVFLAAACCAGIAVLGIGYYFSQEVAEKPAIASVEANTDTYIDEMADYAMIDNAEIYVCLAEN